MVTITLRLIRNFEYRSVKIIPLRDVDVSRTTEELLEQIKVAVPRTSGVPPPFKTHPYDTLKISHQAHGFKANDIVINMEDDEGLILGPGRTLGESGVTDETEISVFVRAEYEAYKRNPVKKW